MTSLPVLRPPADFCLPTTYRQQVQACSRDAGLGEHQYWTDERIRTSAVYQWHVYRWAAKLVRARGLRSVLDIGCGPGTKLAEHIAPVCDDIEGFDQPAGVAAAERLGSPGVYRSVDLESADIQAHRTFDLVLCADVIEHLVDPDPMLDLILRMCHRGSLVLFSTPDRARLHGRACMASYKAEHVREWASPEFRRYLTLRAFRIERERFFPAANEPLRRGGMREMLFRAGFTDRSPHRCHAVLCRPHGDRGV